MQCLSFTLYMDLLCPYLSATQCHLPPGDVYPSSRNPVKEGNPTGSEGKMKAFAFVQKGILLGSYKTKIENRSQYLSRHWPETILQNFPFF